MFAFLPTLTFLGHWNEILGGAAPVTSAVTVSTVVLFDAAPLQTDFARHALHCHTNLGTCTEQPMPSGVGLFTMREQLLPRPTPQLAIMLGEPNPPRATDSTSPPTPPPRSL